MEKSSRIIIGFHNNPPCNCLAYEMASKNIEDANVEDKTNVIPDLGFQVNQVTSTDLYHPEPIQILTRVRKDFKNRKRICVTSLLCVMVHALYSMEIFITI
ncbi:hypothetical protein HN51_018065 [Arachis hypogaea]